MFGRGGFQQGRGAPVNDGHEHHQRYGMPMGVAQPFPAIQHHQFMQQQQRHQPAMSPQSHDANLANYMHNNLTSTSSSRTVPPDSGHARTETPSYMRESPNKPPNEQWQQQLNLLQQTRCATSAHSHARNNAHKAVTAVTADTATREADREEGDRTLAEVDEPRPSWSELDMSGQGLRALSSAVFGYAFLTKLHLNGNRLTSLPSGIGRLRHLVHLDLSQNSLTRLPPELGVLVNLKSLLLFDNGITSLPFEMGYLFRLEMLGLEGNPLAKDLKPILVEEGTRGLISYLQENAPEPDPPRSRDRCIFDESPPLTAPSATRVSVFSYNTLCYTSATQARYGYIPSRVLAWEHRREMILHEVLEQEADIVCLQEIDTESFHEYWRNKLAYRSYKGVFLAKSRARTMTEKEAKKVDGCATFYKNSRYVLLAKHEINLSYLAINREDIKGEHDMFNRVMPRDNIALVTFLESRQTGARLLVINTHFHWDPAFKDVKVIQSAVLMEQITKIAAQYAEIPPCTDKSLYRHVETDSFMDGEDEQQPQPQQQQARSGPAGAASARVQEEAVPSLSYSSGPEIPMILCGDFNSLPGSGVYELLSSGSLAPNHPDLGQFRYGNFTRDGMAHPFPLRSAYANVGELPFTTYTADFTGVVDYIWYHTRTLQVTQLLGEVDKTYLQRTPGCPNYHFPSDHLALWAEFLIKEPRIRRS